MSKKFSMTKSWQKNRSVGELRKIKRETRIKLLMARQDLLEDQKAQARAILRPIINAWAADHPRVMTQLATTLEQGFAGRELDIEQKEMLALTRIEQAMSPWLAKNPLSPLNSLRMPSNSPQRPNSPGLLKRNVEFLKENIIKSTATRSREALYMRYD
ncbi:MAG: hypothetical protein WDO70_04870 [Alphaproteobacteria bacterium]